MHLEKQLSPALATNLHPNGHAPGPVFQSCPCTRTPARLQLEVCKEQVEWATAEKRTFLRQRIEVRLAMLQMERRDYPAALALIGG